MKNSRITVPILRLLHNCPYLSAPEVARALGFSHQACSVALGRLSAAGDVVDRLEGRVIVHPNGTEQVRRLRCYAIAPVEMKEPVRATNVPTAREKVLGLIKYYGDGLAAKEITDGCSMKMPAVARALQSLLDEGRLVREEDERTVCGPKGQRQTRQRIYVYSLAEGSS